MSGSLFYVYANFINAIVPWRKLPQGGQVPNI